MKIANLLFFVSPFCRAKYFYLLLLGEHASGSLRLLQEKQIFHWISSRWTIWIDIAPVSVSFFASPLPARF
ncbi:hypothetical protein B0H13DRAFT_2071008 [Mycena leptocephala]|nr:hypothetical protein B0H13DRAFT_2071008 [Mycena leptocephala]